jgi:hypothetical protein
MSDDQIVLLSTEVDAYVEALEPFELEDIGKTRYEKECSYNELFGSFVLRWHTQHEYIGKLNMQAILDANRNTNEYVREAIVNNDKVNTIYL